MFKVEEFRQNIAQLSREELLDLLEKQNPEIHKQVMRIEWVFKNKLNHLTWNDGTPILERNMTNKELALLLDPPFEPDKLLTKANITTDQQREIFIASDPVMWGRYVLGMEMRAYQILILRDPSNRKIIRAGRRLGKTVCLALKILHYISTHKNGKVLIMAPMKSHVELIYKEVIRQSEMNKMIEESVKRNITSPQFKIEMTNGAEASFFTTGMSSGGKSNVARGQEASLIVLDEFDYMAPDDLDAIYAMLQQTSANQGEKELIGASTPTGRKEKFWEWAHSPRFKEFYFPSYTNPFWDKETEDEMRDQHSPMVYRHEFEADWGEDIEGVYPRRSVDRAFVSPEWDYSPYRDTQNSVYVIGVDWDKYGAGTNIVALEICHDNYDGDPRFAGKIRLAYREETPKEEFTLLNSTNRIIQLNDLMRPTYIYVDRGFGEVQYELLTKHGMENPATGLKNKVVGVSFSEMIEIRDPATKQLVKKDIKPYMVDNLYRFLENNELMIPAHDDELYMQLISYIVKRFTSAGRPVFEASGSQVDHAHDALILACLAITQNYGDFSTRFNLARSGKAVSNEAFLPMFSLSDNPDIREFEEDKIEEIYGGSSSAPVLQKRAFTGHARRASMQRTIRRKGF